VPAVALAQHPKLGHLILVQVGVPVAEIGDGVVEPLCLMLECCLEYAAPQDMGEEFVARLIEGGPLAAKWCAGERAPNLLTPVSRAKGREASRPVL
jgi:hypothetical protein